MSASLQKMGQSAGELVDSGRFWVLRFRLMVKRGLAVAASSIRRRSAAWTVLLDWTYRSRRPASALWMRWARWFGKWRWRASPRPCWRSADSEEKREPASDINTPVVDGLKALDPKRPIDGPIPDSCSANFTSR